MNSKDLVVRQQESDLADGIADGLFPTWDKS